MKWRKFLTIAVCAGALLALASAGASAAADLGDAELGHCENKDKCREEYSSGDGRSHRRKREIVGWKIVEGRPEDREHQDEEEQEEEAGQARLLPSFFFPFFPQYQVIRLENGRHNTVNFFEKPKHSFFALFAGY